MTDELPLEPDDATVTASIEEIKLMTFEDMLRAVRFRPLGDPLFRGEIGKHFHARMKEKRHAISPEARVVISKRIGF